MLWFWFLLFWDCQKNGTNGWHTTVPVLIIVYRSPLYYRLVPNNFLFLGVPLRFIGEVFIHLSIGEAFSSRLPIHSCTPSRLGYPTFPVTCSASSSSFFGNTCLSLRVIGHRGGEGAKFITWSTTIFSKSPQHRWFFLYAFLGYL